MFLIIKLRLKVYTFSVLLLLSSCCLGAGYQRNQPNVTFQRVTPLPSPQKSSHLQVNSAKQSPQLAVRGSSQPAFVPVSSHSAPQQAGPRLLNTVSPQPIIINNQVQTHWCASLHFSLCSIVLSLISFWVTQGSTRSKYVCDRSISLMPFESLFYRICLNTQIYHDPDIPPSPRSESDLCEVCPLLARCCEAQSLSTMLLPISHYTCHYLQFCQIPVTCSLCHNLNPVSLIDPQPLRCYSVPLYHVAVRAIPPGH